ncbi:MAG: 4-deoxy-4-formamido-L-arabinose-phosphoundecaprenol deformylase [Planctomycetes bacterium]|nr:4-deoxy-4-formamido-L-arabinose-phosphoundecaprenol deformylase [Planctomycetota bacterium]
MRNGAAERTVWLRVDVDSYVGARDGLPRLLETLARHKARATFFVNVGPDRWGRAVLRVIRRPGFLRKMLRTGAVKTYGLSTCLRGTLLPSVEIGTRVRDGLRRIREENHEVALHCWDHIIWQDDLSKLSADQIRTQVERGADAFRAIYDEDPHAWAAPGWVSTPTALEVLDDFGFDWMSNSRGHAPFIPIVDGRELQTVDLPTTLPTLDEELGRDGIDATNYVDRLVDQIADLDCPLLVIHTETEGGHYRAQLEDLLARGRDRGWTFRELGGLALEALAHRDALPRCDIRYAEIPGRAGDVTIQGRDRVDGADS